MLTTSVSQIHLDFGLAVDAVKNVDYDVMDLDAAGAFENSYQTFRSGMPLQLPLMSLLLFWLASPQWPAVTFWFLHFVPC